MSESGVAKGKPKRPEGHPVSVTEPLHVLGQKSLRVILRTLSPALCPRRQPEQVCVALTRRLGGVVSTLPARKWVGGGLWPRTARGDIGKEHLDPVLTYLSLCQAVGGRGKKGRAETEPWLSTGSAPGCPAPPPFV